MIQIDPTEIKWSHIRSPGPGGQNVNKVATGVQMRFNVYESLSLPEAVRELLRDLWRLIKLVAGIVALPLLAWALLVWTGVLK